MRLRASAALVMLTRLVSAGMLPRKAMYLRAVHGGTLGIKAGDHA